MNKMRKPLQALCEIANDCIFYKVMVLVKLSSQKMGASFNPAIKKEPLF